MAAEACLSALSPIISRYFKMNFFQMDGWMTRIDGWIDGGREGLGAPHPAWIRSSHHLYT